MLRKIFRLSFCVNWSNSPTHVLASVKKQIKHNPGFVKQNGLFIIHHLSDLIESSQWGLALDFLKQVNTTSIDKWQLWQQFAKVIRSQLRKTNQLSFEQFVKCLQLINKTRYEPNVQEDKLFYQDVQQLIKKNNIEQTIVLSAYVLSQNPDIFNKFKKQLQQQIYNHAIQNRSFKSQFHKFAYIQGIFSNFWEKDFNDKLSLAKISDPSLNKYFWFNNPPQHPIVSTQAQRKLERTATEKKIGQMILDLGYVFKQNILINGIQIDFLIGPKLILEYNGMHHYKINSQVNQISPIHYQVWRTVALTKGGYIVAKIPFLEWQKLQNEKIQKLYLIQKIQKAFLENLSTNKIKVDNQKTN